MNTAPIRLVTPKGLAEYPHIEEPDTKFDDNGVYHVNLILNKEESASIIDKMNEILQDFIANDIKLKEAKARGKQYVLQDFYEELNEDEIRLKFKQKASYIRKSDGKEVQVKIPVFDSKGTPVKDVNIGSNSTLRVCFTANPYYMPATKSVGLSLRLVAVKLIELVERGNGGASGYGFGEEEEGYVQNNTNTTTKVVETFDDLEEDSADF